MDNWRQEAKRLNIPLYHRKKADVIAEIEAVPSEGKEKKVSLDLVTATHLCRKALKDYAVEQGLDPDYEIMISRWYLRAKRKGIRFIGRQKNDSQSENKSEERGGKD